MKNKNTVIILIALLVLLGLFFYFYSGSNKEELTNGSTATSTTESVVNKTMNTKVTSDAKKVSEQYVNKDGVYVVQYTDKGFVPASLQVPKGKSIKFINSSSRGMRIFTSDTSDQKFVELNQPATVSKGGTYSFTVVNAGLWNYYNQTYPTHAANILVY